MAQDPSNILVAGNLRISTAPLGTTLPTALPTDPSTLNLNAAFKDLGYTSPDGQSSRRLGPPRASRCTRSVATCAPWSPMSSRRRRSTCVSGAGRRSPPRSVAALPSRRRRRGVGSGGGGGKPSGTGGHQREFSAVLDLFDGDQIWRFVLRRAMVSNSPGRTSSAPDRRTCPSPSTAWSPAAAMLSCR